jgi:drug/metabolite transporter (DMT)-like permease
LCFLSLRCFDLQGMMGSFLAPFGAAVQTFRVPSSAGAWGLLLGVGLLSYVGQVFFNAGVQLEKAGPASMIRNLGQLQCAEQVTPLPNSCARSQLCT